MSGFAAVVSPSGAEIDGRALDALGEAMAFRGPDGRDLWTGDGAGLACSYRAHLGPSTSTAEHLTSCGHVRATGEVRLTDLGSVRSRLQGRTPAISPNAPDLELVAATYLAHGLDGLARLRGEFAYALWDERDRRLVCGRDPFGVRSLYQAWAGDTLVVGNTLEALRLYPGVADQLDESSIADFLLFGQTWDLERTTFAGIRRVPPAHLLIYESGCSRTRRYWEWPKEEPARRRRKADLIEEVRARLEAAVADRIRSEPISVFMSGGLDSTSVAAMACRSRSTCASTVTAWTGDLDGGLRELDWQPLPSDEEVGHAASVASRFGIEHRVYDFAAAARDVNWQEGRDLPPEPADLPHGGGLVGMARSAAAGAPTALTGEGGDLLFRRPPAEASLFGPGRGPLRTFAALWTFARARGKLPSMALRSRLGRGIGPRALPPGFPPWFDPDFEARLDLRDRWQAWLDALAGAPVRDTVRLPDRTLRPELRRDLQTPYWPHVFWTWSPEVLRSPLSVRHPFFDEGLLRALISVPPVPWFWEKFLLREALRGILPEAVRARAKVADGLVQTHRHLVRKREESVGVQEQALPGLGPYLRIPVLQRMLREPERLLASEVRLITRPVALGWWLKHRGNAAAP